MKLRAFSYLEIILVVTLIAIGLGFFVLYSQSSQVRADLNSQTSTLTSYLRLAQTDALSGKDNSDHGIHLESDSYVIFTGKVYLEADPTNTTIELPGTIVIQNISLNGSGSDIIFTTPHGETSTYGTVDLYSSQIDKTKQITISQLGTIEF